MIGATLGVLLQVLIATVVFSVNMLLIALAALQRALAMLVPVVGRGIWGVLVLSCRYCYLPLMRLAPFIKRRWGINILAGLWRLAATSVVWIQVDDWVA